MLMSIFFWLALLAYFYLYIFYKSESMIFRYIAQFYVTLRITIYFSGTDFSYLNFIIFFLLLSLTAYILRFIFIVSRNSARE